MQVNVNFHFYYKLNLFHGYIAYIYNIDIISQ